jgi:hypothetical protein
LDKFDPKFDVENFLGYSSSNKEFRNKWMSMGILLETKLD